MYSIFLLNLIDFNFPIRRFIRRFICLISRDFSSLQFCGLISRYYESTNKLNRRKLSKKVKSDRGEKSSAKSLRNFQVPISHVFSLQFHHFRYRRYKAFQEHPHSRDFFIRTFPWYSPRIPVYRDDRFDSKRQSRRPALALSALFRSGPHR